MLKAIHNHVVFQFEDSIVRKTDMSTDRMQFKEVTKWGFEVSSYDEGTKTPRWGVVVSVGKEVNRDDIDVGSRVLIEPLKWTEAFKYEGQKYWRTDETCIFGVDEAL